MRPEDAGCLTEKKKFGSGVYYETYAYFGFDVVGAAVLGFGAETCC